MTGRLLPTSVLTAAALFVPGQASRIAGCFERGAPVARWSLPPQYREVSGLALSDDGRLFLHGDERGLVGALDPATGKMLGTFQLGSQLALDDFEGIAIAAGRLYLVTSQGVLYEGTLPARAVTSGTLDVTKTVTGVGRFCEVEGLAYVPGDQVLLLACKSPRVKALRGSTAVFRWSVPSKALATPDRILIKEQELAKGHQGRGFHASGIEVDPATGHYLLVAGPERAIAEVDRSGRVLGSWSLRGKHPQVEGIAVTPSGDVLISDEGVKGPGTVTVYACR